MILGLDTETSGLWRPDLDATDPSQPHLVQLGLRLVDPRYKLAGRLTTLIKPDGWSIEPQAEEVHGISEERCVRYGIPLPIALACLQGFVGRAMSIVGHGIQFDRRIIIASLGRCGASGLWWEKQAQKFFCTMEESTNRVQLPGEFGFKWPSLEETMSFFFPEREFTTSHDADEDIAATLEIHRALKEPPGGRPSPL